MSSAAAAPFCLELLHAALNPNAWEDRTADVQQTAPDCELLAKEMHRLQTPNTAAPTAQQLHEIAAVLRQRHMTELYVVTFLHAWFRLEQWHWSVSQAAAAILLMTGGDADLSALLDDDTLELATLLPALRLTAARKAVHHMAAHEQQRQRT